MPHTREAGRITARHTAAACPDWRSRETWACGPAKLLDSLEEQWAAAGVSERLHVERFRLAPLDAPNAGAPDAQVRFRLSAVEAHAALPTHLLHIGEALGVVMPYGCRMGICRSCLVPLLDSRICDLRTGELHGEPGELMQTCVNGAADPLVLDI